MGNVIEMAGVSKRYLLGEARWGSQSLRDALVLRMRRNPSARSGRDEIWSLKDVSFEVAEGMAVGIIGHNGAGKSTILKILTRITEPTEGMARTRGRVGSLLEVGTGFHPELTGRENIALNGAILGMGRRAIAAAFDEIVSFAGIDRFVDTPVKRYSSGMYLRLAFAVAAHLDAEILLVDEVLAVGDAQFQRKCLGRMAEVERSGRTVVFVSHNLDAIVRLCPTCVWLDQGSIVAQGPAAEIVDAYLSEGISDVDRLEFEDAPGQAAVVRSVVVTDARGRPASVFRRDEPFVIEIGIMVRVPTPGLDLTAYVQTLRGLRVLDEAVSEGAPEGLAAPGYYVARLRIPPLLNVGDYVVGVWLGTVYETITWMDQAAVMRLEGDQAGRPDRLLQLGSPWQVTKEPDTTDHEDRHRPGDQSASELP